MMVELMKQQQRVARDKKQKANLMRTDSKIQRLQGIMGKQAQQVGTLAQTIQNGFENQNTQPKGMSPTEMAQLVQALQPAPAPALVGFASGPETAPVPASPIAPVNAGVGGAVAAGAVAQPSLAASKASLAQRLMKAAGMAPGGDMHLHVYKANAEEEGDVLEERPRYHIHHHFPDREMRRRRRQIVPLPVPYPIPMQPMMPMMMAMQSGPPPYPKQSQPPQPKAPVVPNPQPQPQPQTITVPFEMPQPKAPEPPASKGGGEDNHIHVHIGPKRFVTVNGRKMPNE